MADKKPTHVMVHAKQYMKVDGKMAKVQKGAHLVLSDAQAKSLGKKVAPLGKDGKVVDLTPATEPAKGTKPK